MTANEKQEYAVDNTDFRGKIREEFESNILKTLKAAQDGPLKELFEALLLPLVYSPKNNKQRIEVVSQVADLLNKEFNEIPFDPTLMTRNQYFPDLVEEYINMSCNHSVSRKLEVQGVSETLIFGEHNFFADLWGEGRGNIVKEILFRRLEGSGTDWYEPKMELRTYFRTTHFMELHHSTITRLISYLLYWAAYDKSDLEVLRTWYFHPEKYRGSENIVLCGAVAPWIAMNADKDDKDIIEYCQAVTNDNVASEMMFTALFYSHRQSQWQKACEYLTPTSKKKNIKPLFFGCLNGNSAALDFLIQYILENDLTAVPDIVERISKLPFCYKQCKEDPKELNLRLQSIHTLLTDGTKRKQAFMCGSDSERILVRKVQQYVDWSEGLQWSYELLKTPELSTERKLEALDYITIHKKFFIEEAVEILRNNSTDPVLIDKVIANIGWNTNWHNKELYQMILDAPQKLTRETLPLFVDYGFPRFPTESQKLTELYYYFRSLIPVIPIASEPASKDKTSTVSRKSLWGLLIAIALYSWNSELIDDLVHSTHEMGPNERFLLLQDVISYLAPDNGYLIDQKGKAILDEIGPEAMKVFDFSSLNLGMDKDVFMEICKNNLGADKNIALNREIRKRYPATSLQRKFLFDSLNDREICVGSDNRKEEVRVQALRTIIQLKLSEEEKKLVEPLLTDKKKNIRTAARIVLALTELNS